MANRLSHGPRRLRRFGFGAGLRSASCSSSRNFGDEMRRGGGGAGGGGAETGGWAEIGMRGIAVAGRLDDGNVVGARAHDPEPEQPALLLGLGLLGSLLLLRLFVFWSRGRGLGWLGLRARQRGTAGLVVPPCDKRALLAVRLDRLRLQELVKRQWCLEPIGIGLRRSKESSREPAGLGRDEDRDVPGLGEKLLVGLDVMLREIAALARMTVIPPEQRSRCLAQLLLHPLPQARDHDLRLIAINRLAELQRLVYDGVQCAGFGIAIDVPDEESKDCLRRRALEMLLQGDDRFLLEKDRIRRPAGGLAGIGGPTSPGDRRIPQDRSLEGHRQRLGRGAHASVSTTMRAARSTSDRPTSRCVTARSRCGPPPSGVALGRICTPDSTATPACS